MASEIRNERVYANFKQPKGYAKPRETKIKAAARRPGMSDAHLDCIRSLPCCVCGSRPRSEAHHLLSAGGRGMGLRATDRHTVPLCVADHQTLHAGGSRNERRFFLSRGVDALALADALWRATGDLGRMRAILEAHR